MQTQIIYCNKDLLSNVFFWNSLKRLESKLGGVIRYQEDALDYAYFDRIVLVTEGIEKLDKFYVDHNEKHGPKVVKVSINDVNDVLAYNLLELPCPKTSTLGASWLHWNKKFPLPLNQSFSFFFTYDKPSLEQINCFVIAGDKQYGTFNVAVFEEVKNKCIFNKTLRYIENTGTKVNKLLESETYLKIILDNPQFNAKGKKYAVTVTYSGASVNTPSSVLVDLNYSPHRMSVTGITMFGSVYFFAY